MTWARVLAAILLSILLSSCGGSGPTDSTEQCRNYPLSFEENGLAFACELDSAADVTLLCASGAVIRRWQYASLADFVREPSIPNRTLATTRTTTAGVLLGSFTQTLRSLEYDARGRLARRTRTSSGELGTLVLDETRYLEWDSSGRPTRGEIHSGEETASVVLTYDDGRRLLETSTGESASQDADGNLLNEVEIFGLGPEAFRSEREYRTTATRSICLP